MKKCSSRYRNRRGLAVVEAALTFPLIFLVVLSTVGICNHIYLQQKLEIIAFEAARVAIIPNSTIADVVAQADELAAARGLTDVSVDVEPANFVEATEGTFITVTVSTKSNLNMSSMFSDVSDASVSMMKEAQ